MMSSEHQLYKEAIEGLLPNRDKIQKKVLGQGPVSRLNTKRRRWLIPVAASLLALILVCATVPSVRAAISQWFSRNSVAGYLAQPKEERPSTPELDTIIEQTKPEETEIPNSIGIAKIDPEWQEWADRLNPSIGDVLFDGKELMVSFDMGGGAAEFILGHRIGRMGGSSYPISIWMGSPGYIILNGEKYAFSTFVQTLETDYNDLEQYITDDGQISDEGMRMINEDDSVKFCAVIDLSRVDKGANFSMDDMFKDLTEEQKNEYLAHLEKLKEYDPDFSPGEYKESTMSLSGVQQVELHLPLIATNYSTPSEADDEGVSYQGNPIGMVKLCFYFDPAAGYKNLTSFDINKTIELSGQGTYKWADWESDPDYVTFVNKTVDMAGVMVKAKRIECSASGAALYVSISCPDSWGELEKQCFLGSLLPKSIKGDGVDLITTGEQYGLEEDGEDLGMGINLKLLPSEVKAIKEFEIELTLNRFSGYDDVPYIEGEPTRIKKEDVKGWQEDSQTLDDCILRFSLNK